MRLTDLLIVLLCIPLAFWVNDNFLNKSKWKK